MEFLTFNNREIATGIWLIGVLLWLLSKPQIRESFANVLKAFFHPKLLTGNLLMAVSVVVIVIGLSQLNLWTPELLKDTVYWFFGSALVMASATVTNKQEDGSLKSFITDNLKFIVLIQFLANTYTFSLLGELLFVPFVTIVVMLVTVAEYQKDSATVAKFLNSLQVMIGLLVLGFAVSHAIGDLANLGSWETVRSVLLPFLLSLGFVPVLHLLALYANYETLFIRLKLGPKKDQRVKAYAKRRLVMKLGLNRKRVLGFLRGDARKLMHVQTKEDVDRVLNAISQ